MKPAWDKHEEEFAKKVGGKRQPGSGNKWWAKLDVVDYHFNWSLKSTKKASYRITLDDLHEAFDAVEAPGGVGGDVVPAMGLRIQDEDLVVFRLSDWLKLVQEGVKIPVQPDKAQVKRAQSKIPELFRGED